MGLTNFIIIFTSVALNAFGQLALKFGTNKIGEISLKSNFIDILFASITWPILTGILCYILSVSIWIVALSRVEVSIAYPMLSMGYIIVTFFAWYFLNEQMSFMRLFSLAIIITGIVMLANS